MSEGGGGAVKSAETVVKIGQWIFFVVSVVVSVLLWIQVQGNDKYYPKLSGENLEKQLVKIEQNMNDIESQNIEIIRLLGRIEGVQSTKQ